MSDEVVLPIQDQQGALTLLLFDDQYAPIIRNCIELKTWQTDPHLKRLLEAVYVYVDTYGEAPKEHVFELVKDLQFPDPQTVEKLETLLTFYSLRSKTHNNVYAFGRIEKFVKSSSWKNFATNALKMIDMGQVDQVEALASEAMKQRLTVFDPGDTLSDSLDYLFDVQMTSDGNDKLDLGIPAFTRAGIMPKRQEMFMYLAPTKTGKSWFLIHCAKQGLLEHKRVSYITLELGGKAQVGPRLLQSLFAVAKEVKPYHLRYRLTDHGIDQLTTDPMYIHDEETLKYMNERIKQSPYLVDNFKMKRFPTKGLTYEGLVAYLDAMDLQYSFHPDVLIIDYPDIMKLPGKSDYRHEIGELYAKLRGLAVERNLILIVVTQTNRTGASKEVETVDSTMVGEDFSKIHIADCVITYSQTKQEKTAGLARLYVSNGRNNRDGFHVLISQDYNTGQYVLESKEFGGPWHTWTKDLYDSIKNQTAQAV